LFLHGQIVPDTTVRSPEGAPRGLFVEVVRPAFEQLVARAVFVEHRLIDSIAPHYLRFALAKSQLAGSRYASAWNTAWALL
jgi:hypothetical protein